MATTLNVRGSLGLTSYNKLAIKRVSRGRSEARDNTREGDSHSLPDHHSNYLCALRAKRHAYPDFACSLSDRIRDYAVDPDDSH